MKLVHRHRLRCVLRDRQARAPGTTTGRFMGVFRQVSMLLLFLASPQLMAQATYTTGFEQPTFTLGDVNGQDGWRHIDNSPTRGEVMASPAGSAAFFGTQSLAIRTRNVDFFGVSNHLFSATIDPPAGEPGAFVRGAAASSPHSTFFATLWYRTPEAPITTTVALAGRFAELNPSSTGAGPQFPANRYAQVRLINSTNNAAGLVNVVMRWVKAAGPAATATVATLEWGTWYRFEYEIEMIPGLAGDEANDRFKLTIFDAAANQVGTACGSTWEVGWRSGAYDQVAQPRAIDGFDFWSTTGPNDLIVGHLDNLTMTASTPATAPLTATIAGSDAVCAGTTTTLTAAGSGGDGTMTNYVWRDAADFVVGNDATLDAGPGTYTVTITDGSCRNATSAPFTVTARAPLAVSITGTPTICFGGTTTLSASASGGSGTVSGFTWRNAGNEIVGTGATLDAGAGTYTVTVTDALCPGPATSAPIEVTVTCKATPVVTWIDPAAIVYGTPLSTTQLNATANVPGTFVYTPPAGTVLDAGLNQLLSVDFSPTDSANYEDVNGTTVEIDVLPATPIVTVSGGPFLYDGTPHAATAVARDSEGNVVSGGFTFTYDGNASQPVNAGSYAVEATFTSSDTNFTGATGNGTLVVNPATPVVTWSDPASIVYGTPLGSTQLNATASTAGTFTYTPAAGTLLNAGTNQTLSVDFVPDDANNYLPVANTTVQIDVDRAPTTIAILSTSPDPSTAGHPVIVKFELGGIFGTPGGQVTITDGEVSCVTSATSDRCELSFFTAGIRTVSATFSGDANHFGSTTNAQHEVIAVPTAQLEGSTVICAGQQATLAITLQGVAPWTLIWSDGLRETVNTANHQRIVTPSASTTYTITRVTDVDRRGEASGKARVTVTTIQPPAIVASGPIRLGEPVTLQAGPGYDSYQWLFNGTPLSGRTSASLTLDPVTRESLGSYSVIATRGGCTSTASEAYALVPLGLPTGLDALIPVVGTTHGAGGSLFRTTLHLMNGTSAPLAGQFTFLDETLPPFDFELAAGESRFVDDLLPATFEGLTSVNVRRLLGALPIVVAHVFNDDGELGTSGLIEPLVPAERILKAGDRVALIAPIDPVATRFNVGLRSLPDGFTVRVTRRSRDGVLLGSFERVVPSSTLLHMPVEALTGAPAGSSDSLHFEVLTGHGVVYGAATDNGTNDPNLQLPSRVFESTGTARYILPVAGAISGHFDSRFATGLQLHNWSDDAIESSLTFHPGGIAGSNANPQLAIATGPNATVAYEDIVSAAGGSGLGSIDITTTASHRPLLLARVYSIAPEGQASLAIELVPEEDALIAGESGVIAAPHHPSQLRFNLGVRSLEAGVRLNMIVRRPDGAIVKNVTRSYPSTFFSQQAATDLLDYTFAGDESVVFSVEEGSAIIYGVWTDNKTQDPALQFATRP
jgi:hypothetical protein